ncbi:MAG: hypothetical protein PVJ73_06200 [Acidobacteriota bacterium]|jgi:hypothetical protein
MKPRDLIDQMDSRAVLTLEREDLPRLLEVAETIRADDTGLSGWIRILSIDGRVAVQEQTPDGEVLLRRLASRETAERFVDGRLASYERMWDGCGCKIEYHR